MFSALCRRIACKEDGVYTSSVYVQNELFLKIERVMAEKRLYLDSSLSLETLAEILGTNRTYICECFRSRKTTFKKYINKHRINHLCNLICSEGKDYSNGSDLAKSSGFASRRSMDDILMNNIGKTYYDLVRKKH